MMKKPILFLLTLVGIVIILSFVQVIVSNRLSTTGVTLGKIDDKIAAYKKENAKLSEEVLLASSYTHIASNAANFGFIDKRFEGYISSPLSLAIR